MKTTNTHTAVTLALATALGSGTVQAGGDPFGMQRWSGAISSPRRPDRAG